ncbi:polysaccharide deacetylase family protein [Paenibacillus albus]|uniref:Polysaccharide deacetylase n=1 Tax=Paenibacillus albus TaxID=2495582 RepID=A0A3S9AC57_9BACL|nr:hypothetical protein [Paenibacillus albus]AZN43298.1 hypothetical protein EJC50_29125 [Paenibacillus albus]
MQLIKLLRTSAPFWEEIPIVKADLTKTILLTFDYEVFFNRPGTFERCILEPVDELIRLMEQHQMGATYFIDMLYYSRLLEQEETKLTALAMKRQLQRLVQAGHRIEPHLHPHWLDAEWEDGNWAFPHYKRYRLQSLSEDEILAILHEACRMLEEIAREVDPSYKVMAYRAGGWCIQPFDKLVKAFGASELLVDSSVAPGMRGDSEAHYFEFSHVKPVDYYRFECDPTLVSPQGSFVEIPISTYHRSAYNKLRNKVFNRFYRRRLRQFGDGRGIPLNTDFRKKWLATTEMVTLERMYPNKLMQIIKQSKQSVVNIISHPKGLSPISMECLLKLAESKHRCITIKKYYDEQIAGNKDQQAAQAYSISV